MSKLAEYVPLLAQQKVLCLGDVMLDRFIYGRVSRISPEAPIPVLAIEREQVMLGGAGNVARNLVALGGMVDFVGVIGTDPAGYEVSAAFADMKNVTPLLVTDRSRPTTLKVRYIAGNQQMLRADAEISRWLSADTALQVQQNMLAHLADAKLVLLSDYGKGTLTDTVLASIIDACKAQNKILIIDPKGRDYKRYQGATLITPNRKELAEATNLPVSTLAEVESAARSLMHEAHFSAILCTLSADGMLLVEHNGKATHIPTAAREVFDVSGAGDTVMATLALGLAAGLSMLDAAHLANIAAGVVVAKAGTATCSADELLIALTAGRESYHKILPLKIAALLAENWRQRGLTVGFTNGCFDLLHPGHISSIESAKQHCDKLIVGVNSDASVQKLKGPTRPIQAETARAAVLAAMSAIDMVVVFNEDTPYELIKALRPKIIVKGGDYKAEDVVGADLVAQEGGHVVIIPIVDGFSTTNTVQKMHGKG